MSSGIIISLVCAVAAMSFLFAWCIAYKVGMIDGEAKANSENYRKRYCGYAAKSGYYNKSNYNKKKGGD